MEKEPTITATQLYLYLNRKGLCDQIYLMEDEMIFYHWNKVGSQLTDSLIVKGDRIHKLGYSRDAIPYVFDKINFRVINNLDPKEHKFIRRVEYD